MVNRLPAKAHSWQRISWCFSGLLVASLLFILYPQMMLRFHCRQASEALRLANLPAANAALNAAQNWTGTFTGSATHLLLNLTEGDYLLARADSATDLKSFLSFSQQSAEKFQKAIDVSPLNVDGYTGLARATDALERLYPFLKKTPYKQDAQPIYLKLLALMPSNVYAHTLLIRYYLTRNKKDELLPAIAKLISTFPPSYFQLKQQDFYEKSMNSMVKTELEQAIARDVCANQAKQALSDIFFEESNFAKALEWYGKSEPSNNSSANNSAYLLRLGFLQLKADQIQNARSTFISLALADNADNTLERIYQNYLKAKMVEEFLQFAADLKQKKAESEFLQLLLAKSSIELDRDELAKSILTRIKGSRYLAESNFLLSQIAERHQDWDEMELRSQHATVYNSKNPTYFMQLSRALQKQQKYESAEYAADQAIAVTKTENPWLYNHRAWLRWAQKKYNGAQKDWERAIEISPKTAGFYHSMALVYAQAANIDDALRNIHQAITLQPDNQQFRQKLQELEKLKTP